jgi:hypothetical protein
MGMFDYLRCEVPLPDGARPAELQTKDFDCDMLTHVISSTGQLLLDQGEDKKPIDHCGTVFFCGDGHYYRALFDHGQLVRIETRDVTRDVGLSHG